MRINLFTSLLAVCVIICLRDGVNAEYCADDVTAGKCFRESIVPLVIGATTVGFVFGIILLILSLCLFYQTKVKDNEIDWVHDKEPSDWVRNVQSFGIVNNGHRSEPRKPSLGDNKPRHFVSDRSLYSERATTSAFPSSNASDIMSAMDEIEDGESIAPSAGYYWAHSNTRDNDTFSHKEKGAEYETITSSITVESAQILHRNKSKTSENPSPDSSTLSD